MLLFLNEISPISYYTISLLSFIVKFLEKVVDSYYSSPSIFKPTSQVFGLITLSKLHMMIISNQSVLIDLSGTLDTGYQSLFALWRLGSLGFW